MEGFLQLSIAAFSTIKMSSNFNCSYMARSSLEWRARLSDTILKGTHPGTIPARFGLIWFSGFRGEDLNVIVYKSSPLKPLNQIKPNLAGMVSGWVPFKIVSDSPALHSRCLNGGRGCRTYF
jgi:hypothetical protein